MKKLIYVLAMIIFCVSSVKSCAVDAVHKAIADSKISRGAISISVRDLQTGKIIYDLNDDKPVTPASTQKLITSAVALDTLGSDYKFTTSLYKSTNNDLYLKLGADPYLSTKDLKNLFSVAKSKNIVEPKNIYIDDYVLDSVNWGEGWQWDDDLNPLMPKFGSYNLDRNLISVVIAPTTQNAPANIYPEVFYPLTFMNLVTTGKENRIKISHNTDISSEMLQIEGVINKLTKRTIPVSNMKRYFRLRLEDAVSDSKVLYYGKFVEKELPKSNVYLVHSVEHPIGMAMKDSLRRSNNMIAETLFKVAGGKFVGNTGSIEAARKMFEEFCSKQGLDYHDIRIADGSGVSKNNLMTARFMTEFLVAVSKLDNFEIYKAAMAEPGVGTLSDRMLYFKDNLRAKTGTLTDVSSIAGYITTRNGKEYAFDIMINDPKSKPADKKMLEEYILRAIYTKY